MRKNSSRKGQSIVEFAIIFPLLIFMLLVLFDLGRAVLDYSILNNAVREGTRFAIVQPGGDIIKHVMDQISGISNFDPSLILINFSSDNNGNKMVSISVSYAFKPILSGMLSAIGFSSLTINANSQMYLSPYAQ